MYYESGPELTIARIMSTWVWVWQNQKKTSRELIQYGDIL